MRIKCFICLSCKHYTGQREYNIETCAAFPDQIPIDILHLRFDHREPHPNDNAIQYEMDSSKLYLMLRVEEEFQILENNKRAREAVEQKRQQKIAELQKCGISLDDIALAELGQYDSDYEDE